MSEDKKLISEITNKKRSKKEYASKQILTSKLYQAIISNNLEEAKDCIKKGAYIDVENTITNAVILSAQYGRKRILRYLIGLGVNVDCKDLMGATPLMWASFSRKIDIANMLIDAGADINVPDGEYAATPLIWWTANCNDEFGLIENLLNQGANPLYRDIQGKTAIEHAKENSIWDTADKLEKYSKRLQNLKSKLTVRFAILKKYEKKVRTEAIGYEKVLKAFEIEYGNIKELIENGATIDCGMVETLKFCAEYYDDQFIRDICAKEDKYEDMRARAKRTQRRIRNRQTSKDCLELGIFE